MNKQIVSTVVGLVASLSTVGVASADSKCENVDIKVTNKYVNGGDNKDIKVVDIDYYDAEDSKWRSELTTDKIIGWGDDDEWVKNLEYVGGESGVKVRIHFKYNLGGTSWSGEYTRTSAAFTCIDNKDVSITID